MEQKEEKEEENNSPPSKEHFLWRYVMGDMPALNEWLDDKPWLIQLPNWALRSIGAPIFLNNPISGALILIGMFIHNSWMAICGLLGLFAAIATASLIGLPRADIAGGGATFHGMLTGIVIAISIDADDWYPWTIFPVIFMSVISVYLASALGFIFSKFDLPAVNLPFNVATFLFLGAVRYSAPNEHFPLKVAQPILPNQTFGEASFDWNKMFHPLLLAGAQIYGSDKLSVGALVLAAMFIDSPVMAYHNIIGSLLSIFTALALAVPPVEIYNGSWSYNALLVTCSLGGFFWVLTLQTHILALIAAITSTVTYGAISSFLRPSGLPTLAFPFAIITPVFLAVTSESPSFRRVPMEQLSYPEKHWKLYRPRRVSVVEDIVLPDQPV